MAAASAGADALGFIFHPASPRYVTPERAQGHHRGASPAVSHGGRLRESGCRRGVADRRALRPRPDPAPRRRVTGLLPPVPPRKADQGPVLPERRRVCRDGRLPGQGLSRRCPRPGPLRRHGEDLRLEAGAQSGGSPPPHPRRGAQRGEHRSRPWTAVTPWPWTSTAASRRRPGRKITKRSGRSLLRVQRFCRRRRQIDPRTADPLQEKTS